MRKLYVQSQLQFVNGVKPASAAMDWIKNAFVNQKAYNEQPVSNLTTRFNIAILKNDINIEIYF